MVSYGYGVSKLALENGLIRYRIGDSDDFITELWKVHLRVKEEGYVQVRFHHLRSVFACARLTI